MKGKTHAGVGIIAVICIAGKIPGELDYLGLVLVLVGSLLPDIDHPKSVINKYILPFDNKLTKIFIYSCAGIILLWYDYLNGGSYILKALAVTMLLIALSTHRNGLTHSAAGMIMFSFIAGYLGNSYGIPYLVYYFMIGYGMHLICDMATNNGIPLLYPFGKKKVKFPFTYKSSSKLGAAIENIIIIAGLILAVVKLPAMFN
ncbi:MAG: metal-dependent hydrolase [Clostridiaceae bacterium]